MTGSARRCVGRYEACAGELEHHAPVTRRAAPVGRAVEVDGAVWWGFMVAVGSFWFPGLGQVAQMILGKAAFLEAGRTASIAVLSRHAHAH